MYERYKVLKTTVTIYLTVIMILSFHQTFKSAPTFCDGTYIRYMRIFIGVILFFFFFFSFLFFFFFLCLASKSSADTVNKIVAMQTIGQVVEIRLTT